MVFSSTLYLLPPAISYLVTKHSILRTRLEQPITGDHDVSMDYGPVLSGVYDLIKGQPVDEALPLWSTFISPRNANSISLLRDPGNEELCEAEAESIPRLAGAVLKRPAFSYPVQAFPASLCGSQRSPISSPVTWML